MQSEATSSDTQSQGTIVSDSTAINWKPLYLWYLLSVLAISCLFFLLWQNFRRKPSEAQVLTQSVMVELQEIKPVTVEESSRFLGQLEAQQGVVLQAETQGRITQIYVFSGEQVSAGDPIVKLSSERIEAEARNAESLIRSAQASRSNALAQLEVAKADQISAAAELDLQQQVMERTLALVKAGALPQQDLDISRRNITSAQAELDASFRRVNAAQAVLEQSDADIIGAQADADAVLTDLNNTLVVSPITGQVGDMSIKPGDYVTSSTQLTTIVENNLFDLEILIPVERRADLKIGTQVALLDYTEKQSFSLGNISFISPQIRANSQLVKAEATFENLNGRLQDDQRVQAQIIWNEEPGILIPSDAVLRIGETTFVFVAVLDEESRENKTPQWIVEQRSIQLGNIQDNQYQVISGLNVGEQIVVSGVLNLSDGALIEPKMANISLDGNSSDSK